MEQAINIIITEDDDGLRFLMQNTLKHDGFNTKTAACAKELFELVKKDPPDLLLLDYKLPDMTVSELLDKLEEKGYFFPFIVITGHGDERIAVEMMKRGARDYLIKDIKLLEILPSIVRRVAKEIVIQHELTHTRRILNETEANYMLLAQNIADIVWTADLGLTVNFISPSAEKLLGFSLEELHNLKLINIVDISSSDEARRRFNNFIKNLRKHRDDISLSGEIILELPIIRKDGTRFWSESKISAMRDGKNKIIGILGSTRNIEIRKITEIKLQESNQSLYNALVACINAMGKTTEIRDPYTAGHQRKVAKLAHKIALEMGLPENICSCVKMAGEIHDLGKIAIPSEILSKPGKISENEYKIIKTHPSVGYEILHTIKFPWPLAEIILQHHERMDGSGYPNGITGDEMHPEAKIIAVADVVEAIASHRPYRAALGIDKAILEIETYKGSKYDAVVVEYCRKVIEKYEDIFA